METSQPLVIVEKQYEEGRVWVIKLNRPERRNAVDFMTANALSEAFIAFERDENACVAILYGEGGHFCAGADLQAMSKSTETDLNNVNRLVPVPSIEPEPSGAILDTSGPMGISRMVLSKPVIAAVSGYAVAGGFELACWCDLRVADTTATFGVFCRRFGVPLIDGGTIRLPALIGQSRAMDLILTGRAVSAIEAFQIGLVNRIVDVETSEDQKSLTTELPPVLSASLELAKLLTSFPQLCMRSDRLSTIINHGKPTRQAIEDEFRLSERCVRAEGIRGAKNFASGVGRHGAQSSIPKAKL